MQDVLIGSIVSALATGLGAVPILTMKVITHRWRDILLAFTAGIMVSATMFNLIPVALDYSNLMTVTIGILLGTLVLSLMERNMPHIDLAHAKSSTVQFDQKSMLIITAITLHNLPEGLSVGVSYASESAGLGPLIALAIGLQNAPEGFLVALFLVTQKVKKFTAFLIATLTGTVEIVTGLIGFFLTSYVSNLVPYGLAFAAGAMLFIVYKELIPESHGDGHESASTFSFILGLIAMIAMIEWFG
ncbi:ZIP family metal transporter [Paenibacillus sp.]|uniref:ZIP family metal transporter n=1 Tax=Paenibacillus sp. TaxID=58172 RepID=UPI002D67E002|nr:ZIP family metal transporter [Paenibacillus sp.]HZG56983.1 ZIP family metal transporter [Paenibacillus sp.]